MVASSIMRRKDNWLMLLGRRPSMPLELITMLCTCDVSTPTCTK